MKELNHKDMDATTLMLLLCIGLVAGVFSGFIGIGGGLIIVPALVLLMGFSQHAAQGTSLAMMLPPIGLLAVYNYHKSGYVDLKVSMLLALAFVIGGYFGSKFAIGLSPSAVKRIFGVFIILVGFKMIFGK